MEVTNQTLAWDSNDEVVFRTFLLTETGKRLVPKVFESAPVLLDSGDTNSILIRTGTLLGFQLAIRSLLDLAYMPPAPVTPTSEYPDLLDNAAWQKYPGIEKEIL